jgi:hypothetical protein
MTYWVIKARTNNYFGIGDYITPEGTTRGCWGWASTRKDKGVMSFYDKFEAQAICELVKLVCTGAKVYRVNCK